LRWQEAVDAYERAIPLDPGAADAYRFEVQARAALGDPEGALRTADRCDANAPTSAACPLARTMIHVDAGDCAALEADARALVLRDPASMGPRWLAEALASEDAPAAAVKSALDSWVALRSPDPQLALQMRLSYAFYVGDFDDTRAAILELEALAAHDAN